MVTEKLFNRLTEKDQETILNSNHVRKDNVLFVLKDRYFYADLTVSNVVNLYEILGVKGYNLNELAALFS